MAELSSTSNSKPVLERSRIPWAFILAILVLVCLEFFLRMLPQNLLLGYGRGYAQYWEVLHHLEEFGPADVGILGSSRAREAILIPLIGDWYEGKLGRKVRVSNYACAGNSADEVFLTVRRLVKNPQKPYLLLCLLSPRLLLGEEQRLDTQAVLWDLEDWKNYFTTHGWRDCASLVPFAVRRIVDRYYKTYRYRYRIRHLLTVAALGRMSYSAVKGEITEWHRYEGKTSLISRPVSSERVKRYVGRLLNEKGEYVFGTRHIESLRKVIAICRNHGVDLVLVEVPLSETLRQHLPAEAYANFLAVIENLAAQGGVKLVRVSGQSFSDRDFLEQSHLNYIGAVKFTDHVINEVLTPHLENFNKFGIIDHYNSPGRKAPSRQPG